MKPLYEDESGDLHQPYFLGAHLPGNSGGGAGILRQGTRDLSLAECATLAGIITAQMIFPSNTRRKPKVRDIVLGLLKSRQDYPVRYQAALAGLCHPDTPVPV
ncbi:MAG: hypothetical protein ACLSUW_04265 [Akkermansia sp.]